MFSESLLRNECRPLTSESWEIFKNYDATVHALQERKKVCMRKVCLLVSLAFIGCLHVNAQVAPDSVVTTQTRTTSVDPTDSLVSIQPVATPDTNIAAVQPEKGSMTSNGTATGNLNGAGSAPEADKGPVYNINPWIDIPLTVLTDAYALYGMSVIYGRDETPLAEINALRRENINKFDRPVSYNYSESAKSASDLFFYGSMPLPLLMLIDKPIRKDGLKVGLMYLQSMGITGTLYTSAAMIASRFRPYAYNEKVDMGTRQRGGAKNSFYAGHPSVVATSTFFMAKVWSDYHPNMKGKWILYGVAAGATAATGLLRIGAGQHFRTDVIVGCTVGAAVGVLVPHFHKNRKGVGRKLTLLPNFGSGSHGFTAFYKL